MVLDFGLMAILFGGRSGISVLVSHLGRVWSYIMLTTTEVGGLWQTDGYDVLPVPNGFLNSTRAVESSMTDSELKEN
ncbi:hypothetical protein Tco_1495949, partial [Tanacetum coccineum]